jgi:hypothetical protein
MSRIRIAVVLFLVALVLTACAGAAAPLPEPTSAPAEGGVAPSPTPFAPATQGPSLQETPPPAITEARAVELEWPLSVRVGDSDFIRLALVAREDGYVTPTAEADDHATSGSPIAIPDLYDTHFVLAVARLDSVGLAVDRAGDWEQPLLPGESPRWQWTITPRQSGRQVATLTLHLRFTPKAGGDSAQREVWHRTLTINTNTVLGLSGPLAQVVGGTGAVVGSVLGFPFMDKVLGWIWNRLWGRRRAVAR